MDRFNTFHIADPQEPAERDDFPRAERYGNRVASRRWLADRFAVSPYRSGDVDTRQLTAAELATGDGIPSVDTAAP